MDFSSTIPGVQKDSVEGRCLCIIRLLYESLPLRKAVNSNIQRSGKLLFTGATARRFHAFFA